MEKISIRWMIKKDMPHVYKLQENLIDPWDEEKFLNTLIKSNCIGMIAESEGQFLGYMIYELHKTCFYIANLAVVETNRRQKIGTQLVKLLKDRLNINRRHSLNTNVRETDLPTQLFLKTLELKARLIKDYYETEDSYFFSYKTKV